MVNDFEEKPIQSFPRRELPFRFSRRELFGLLSTELKVSEEEAQGIPNFTLAGLGDSPNDYLSQVVPVIQKECEISVSEDWVWGKLPGEKRPKKLFPMESAVVYAFNQFNGHHDIGEAAILLAREMDWDEERAFELVRDLFLHLVQQRVCIPR